MICQCTSSQKKERREIFKLGIGSRKNVKPGKTYDMSGEKTKP